MANHQFEFELYMSMISDDDDEEEEEEEEQKRVSCRNRHYDASRLREILKTNIVYVSQGSGGSRSKNVSGTAIHGATSQAQDAAVNFADVIRQKAFSPPVQFRQSR